MKNKHLPIAAAGSWVVFSEFVRNELFLKHFWSDHFSSLGLSFETTASNGLLWIVWSFMMVYIIYKLLQKFSFKETIILTWLPSFLMMWVTIYNLQVLPLSILWFSVPMSIAEVVVAAIIIKKTTT